MDSNRRIFLENILAAGALGGVLPALGAANPDQSPAQGGLPSKSDVPEHSSAEYWNQFYLPLDPTAPKTRGPRPHIPPSERQIMFLHSGAKGLRYAEDISEDELLDYPGDVQVSLVVGQFRPGGGDQEYLKHAPSPQLRVDCVQSKPFREILAPLAWCAMASLKTDQAGRLPSLDALGFRSANAMSGVTKVLLPGGGGKMAVNLYVAKGQSLVEKIMKQALQYAPSVAMVMNLPAISVPALRTFSEIFGALEERSAFLMSSQLTEVVATRQALADPDRPISYLHLVPGEYVLVPKAHADELKPHLERLQLEQGYLVARDASLSDPVLTRKDQAVPGVTYTSLRVSVGPAPSGPAAANPTADGNPSEGGAASARPHGGGVPSQSKPPAGTPKK